MISARLNSLTEMSQTEKSRTALSVNYSTEKDTDSVPSSWWGFWGLIPPNTAPSPPKFNYEAYKSVKFLSNFSMSSPP